MPVPKSSVESSPRKLLRDVVLEKMLAAIQDGTLQAGERLNDDELVQWLGVSRTPIREAIAKLVDYGLVEMEANRYTRVAVPTAEQFDDAILMYNGFAELAARWATPRMDDAAKTRVLDLLAVLRKQVQAEDTAAFTTIGAVMQTFIAESGNALMAQLGASLTARMQFVMLAAPGMLNWDLAAVDTLETAFRSGDGDAVGGVLRGLAAAWIAHARELRSATGTLDAARQEA